MADSATTLEFPQESSGDVFELNGDLERMIEDIESMSVQLSWMTYDLVALRTSPELRSVVQKLEEACHRCRAVVSGAHEVQE